MSTVCIIPAKGTSKRIPRKNIRPFFGKPIIAYSIEAARQSGLFDGGVYVSTEDAEVARIAQHYGAWVIERPQELAEIDAPDCGTQEVTRHALMKLGITDGYACCIYPCAPTMLLADIGAVRTCWELSQWRDICYVKGWMYWGTVKRFIESPELKSSDYRVDLVPHRRIDIDNPSDWNRALSMYANLHNVPVAVAEIIAE